MALSILLNFLRKTSHSLPVDLLRGYTAVTMAVYMSKTDSSDILAIQATILYLTAALRASRNFTEWQALFDVQNVNFSHYSFALKIFHCKRKFLNYVVSNERIKPFFYAIALSSTVISFVFMQYYYLNKLLKATSITFNRTFTADEVKFLMKFRSYF